MSTTSMALPFPNLAQASRKKPAKETGTSPAAKTKELAEPMNTENQTPDHHDDLRQIKGVGPSIAQALHELGLDRYADLAALTADSLADLLKGKIPAISPQRIERDDWLGQARALAQSQPEPVATTPEAPQPAQVISQEANSAQPSDDLSAQAEEQKISAKAERNERKTRPARKDWREVADFFVSFGFAVDADGREQLQTKVHHSQAEVDQRWPGVVTDELVRWMLYRANLPPPAEMAVEPEPSAPEPAEETAAFLDLADLWVEEVAMPVPMGGDSPALLRATSRLILSGSAAIDLTIEQIPFTIELYLVDTELHQSRVAASYPGQLRPGQFDYDIEQDFPVPPAGRYQLHLLASLLPPKAIKYLQGPLIRVET